MDSFPWSLFSPWSQTIGKFVNDPVTNWQDFFNPQVTFNYNPQDVPIEAHVLSKVGSYGSQLSTLIDVIDVLQKHIVRDAATPAADLKALIAFDKLRNTAQVAVDQFRALALPTADDIVGATKALKERDPGGAQNLRERLNGVFDTADDQPQ
jgi:hypothetical protein